MVVVVEVEVLCVLFCVLEEGNFGVMDYYKMENV